MSSVPILFHRLRSTEILEVDEPFSGGIGVRAIIAADKFKPVPVLTSATAPLLASLALSDRFCRDPAQAFAILRRPLRRACRAYVVSRVLLRK